jgi:hypothetical protein
MLRITIKATANHELKKLLPVLNECFEGSAEFRFVVQERDYNKPELPFTVSVERHATNELEPVATLDEYKGRVAFLSFVCGILNG